MELFVVIAVIVIIALMFDIPVPSHAKARAQRVQCVNNLKQTGSAFGIWANDNGGRYPMEISETNGGTMEFTSGPSEWRHFQVMSNELSTPRTLLCPADDLRPVAATNFVFFNNSNVSYFVSLSAVKTDPSGIWSGDRNITNGTPIKNGILELTTNQPTGWTAEMHKRVGNIALSDGSISQVSQTGLRTALANSGLATNRLQMPILAP